MQRCVVAVIWNVATAGVLCTTAKRLGGWCLPGGKVEDGESAKEALGRELIEETGWLVGSASHLIRRVNGSDEVETYLVIPVPGPCEPEPGQRLAWFQPEELQDQDPHWPNTLAALQAIGVVSDDKPWEQLSPLGHGLDDGPRCWRTADDTWRYEVPDGARPHQWCEVPGAARAVVWTRDRTCKTHLRWRTETQVAGILSATNRHDIARMSAQILAKEAN